MNVLSKGSSNKANRPWAMTFQEISDVKRPLDVLKVSLPLVLYFGLMFLFSMLLGRRVGACHADCTAVAFTVSGNNFELAIDVAVAMFGIDSHQDLAFTYWRTSALMTSSGVLVYISTLIP